MPASFGDQSAADVAAAVATHSADTTSVHGIADTSKLATFDAGNPADTVISAVTGAPVSVGGGGSAATTTFTPAGSIAATNVQTAVEEVASEAATALSDHLADGTDAHDASAISSVPAGNLAATNVQAALNELDTEKASTAGVTSIAAAYGWPVYVAGGYYSLPYGNAQNAGMTIGQMIASWLPVPENTNIDRIGVYCVIAGAGSLVRVSVYDDTGTGGTPGALLFDAGTVDTSTTGAKEITVTQTLPAGGVWLVAAATTGTGPSINGNGSPGPATWSTSADVRSVAGWKSNANTFTGAAPASFPAGSAHSVSPRVAFRVI